MLIRALIRFDGTKADRGRYPDDYRQIFPGRIYKVKKVSEEYREVIVETTEGDVALDFDEFEVVEN